MPRTRTPPLLQPNGYEKQTERIEVGCTLTEKMLWSHVFGRAKLADTARILLNTEAYKLANIPVPPSIPG